MFSKLTIALCLAAIADLAVANPIRRDAISKHCKDAGLGDHCCITFVKQRPRDLMTEQDRNDLMATIAGQSKKDGRFDRTTYGDWTAAFDTIIFSDNDLVNSEILQVWFNTIKKIKLPETATFGNVILQIKDGTDDISNYMTITRN